MEVDLFPKYSKATLSGIPINMLNDQEVIRLLCKPSAIFEWDCGLADLLYLRGNLKIVFDFEWSFNCSAKPPCNATVEKIVIYYYKNGAEL
jgi:hypothetical protein